MPVTLKSTVGLIKGTPKSYTEEELKENLATDVIILKVERMRTMDLNRNLKDTEIVKIVCKAKDLPANVELYGCFFKVELYLFPIKQCKNCWAFGHRKEKCWRTTKCRECGENHAGGSCKRKSCINCGGSHDPTDRQCPEKKKQIQINLTMQQEKMTYREARAKWNEQNQYKLLSNEEEFPDITPTLHKRNPTSTQYKTIRGTTKKPDHQLLPSAPQTKVSYADKVKEKAQSQFVENSHKTND
ncbi:uncharacterized protein LOC110679717 [Aedes aegypti]|uniref:Uncharacterized protein n=1 Tax=Aedes aegypti TaxID=7159 RepID=A0A6I8U7C1_AEDAE|nr:uncharacterized protein LOC110679717 [Aedes aegypti]